MSESEHPPCPKCGGEVDYYLTCHTYSNTTEDGGERWMGCMPCDSATYWYCTDFDSNCDWAWTDGLNPRNPRSVENDKNRPPDLENWKGRHW